MVNFRDEPKSHDSDDDGIGIIPIDINLTLAFIKHTLQSWMSNEESYWNNGRVYTGYGMRQQP